MHTLICITERKFVLSISQSHRAYKQCFSVECERNANDLQTSTKKPVTAKKSEFEENILVNFNRQHCP